MSKNKRLSFLLDEEDNAKSLSIERSDDDFFNPNKPKNQLRYRCEQINATHTDKEIVFNANVKKEYLVNFIERSNPISLNVSLKDYVFNADPKHYEIALKAFSELEYLKENVKLNLNKEGKINSILNHSTIQNAWNTFKTDILPNEDFFIELKKVNKAAAQDIIDNGDIEFGKEKNLIKTYDKNLFYHILLDSYLLDLKKENNSEKVLKFSSQIFQKIDVEVLITESVISEDENFIHKRRVGAPMLDKLNVNELRRQYDLFYKPMIEYNYTEYNYIYRLSYKIDKKTGFITEAKAVFSEQIKNNYEFLTEFNMKQVAL
ncbi:hypothetical protein [Olleya sp. HaHaR_3_96]|uniref:hypothetical protein n=1 Tax=Olleya sp. HaHaR_3_96 TaxID=2745560 RepID=UPI001C4E9E35|nr:hypothetical protein [Olleya sp. HaHaR_3_96]QXP59336.1 hypothetical protein H0I26_15630 [Olleya sp. HaHaR_3_96]